MGGHLSRKFYDAVSEVSVLHRHQIRKSDGRPYVSHLFGVAALVLDFGGDEEQAIAALYHDAVEDQGDKISFGQIGSKYGARVQAMVEGCTEAPGQEGAPKAPWQERKDRYVARMANKPVETLLIACADKLYNLRDLRAEYELKGEETWAHFKGGKTGTLAYNNSLARIFAQRLPNPIAQIFQAELEDFSDLLARDQARHPPAHPARPPEYA